MAREELHADVTVIGGSLVGLLTATWLAEADVNVILVERMPTLASGAVGMGFVEPGVVEHPARTARALGTQRYEELLEFARRNRDLAMESGFLDPCGVVWGSLDHSEPEVIDASVKVLRKHGETVHYANDEQTDRLVSGTGFTASMRLPNWGRIHPKQVVAALQARLQSAGGRVLLGETATLASWEPIHVDTEQRRIHSELVVLAAGYGTAAFERRLGDSLLAVRESVLVFDERRDPGAGRAGQGWTSWQARDNTTWVSGARWATPHMEAGETSLDVAERVADRLTAFARNKLGIRASELSRHAFITCSTRDQLPLIGPLQGQPRVTLATGFGANAASWSFASAKSLVDGILHGETTVPDLLRSRRLVRWTR